MMNEAKMMNMSDGVESKDDIILVCGMADALSKLKEMIAKTGDHKRWQFRGVHLGKALCFGKTEEDLYRAFLLWSQKPADREAGRFNLSKALQRITSFADFQEKSFDKFLSTPVQFEEKGFEEMKAWLPSRVPDWTEPSGAIIWEIDMGGLDTKALKVPVENKQIFRAMWMNMMQLMFDDACAIHGCIIVENLKGMGFSDMMTINNKFSGIQDELNQMFYGCFPFKMKSCVLVGSPWWMNALMAFMRLFISKKMSERIVSTDIKGAQKYVGGAEFLPSPTLGTRPFVDRWKSKAAASLQAEAKAKAEAATKATTETEQTTLDYPTAQD